MNLPQILDQLHRDSRFMRNVTAWKVLPSQAAKFADFPDNMNPALVKAVQERGIKRLYSHQTAAIEHIINKKNVVIVTPTASGKTLCYNLPVLNTVLSNPEARALYMFPTKALSHDQVIELQEVITHLSKQVDFDIKSYTFDGDTPASARKAIRSSGHIVVTNPDMLHAGVLPHHTKWVKLFENLEYIVIDELHNYRGVYGSHLANLLRRLKRICKFYGSNPRYICCSATIANPKELAELILDQPVELVDENGAPSGEKHFILYNPPMVNRELGIRRSVIKEARGIARKFLLNKRINALRPEFFQAHGKTYWSLFVDYEVVSPASDKDTSDLNEPQQLLYQRLREWRKEKGEKEKIPVFIIATNDQLRQLVKRAPRNPDALRQVRGFGKKKTQRYGPELVELITAFYDRPVEQPALPSKQTPSKGGK